MAKLNKTLLLVCSVMLLVLHSCKLTDELDLDKDIMLDMRIAAGGLSFPFGDLDKMYLDSLLKIEDDDPDAVIQKIDGNRYGIKTSGDIEKTLIEIDEISFDIANPEIDPIVTNFDDPTPDNFNIDTTKNRSVFQMSVVDIASINASLPRVSSSKKNDSLVVSGLPVTLTIPFQMDTLFMGQSITISKSIVVETPSITESGTFDDFDVLIEFDTIISVGGFVYTMKIHETTRVQGADYVVPRSIYNVTIPQTIADCGFVYDDFSPDIERIQSVFFIDEHSTSPFGQNMSFEVNLTEVDQMFIEPSYRIRSLTIDFPDEFELVKDPDYELGQYVSIVDKSQFSLSMPDGASLNVNLLENKLVDPAHPTKLPVSFYVKKMDLDKGPDTAGGSIMTYSGNIYYNLEFEITGQPFLVGEDSLNMVMGIDEKINMKDVLVTTKQKLVSFQQGTVDAKGEVDGLDDVTAVNTITFNPVSSQIFVKISDLDLSVFEVEESVGGIHVQFPSVFSFADECKDMDGNVVGYWDSDIRNKLVINSKKALGNTIVLPLNSLNTNEYSIIDGKMVVNEDITYWGDIALAAKTDLTLSDLSQLGDQEADVSVWGVLDIIDANVVTSVITTLLNDSSTITLDEDVDDALILVKSVDLVSDAELSVNLKFDGIPGSIEKMYLDKFSIIFPDFIGFKYVGGDSRISLDRNILYVDGDLIGSELASGGDGFTISGLYITGMEFDKPLRTKIVDGKRRLVLPDQAIYFTGDVKVSNKNISSSELSDITIIPDVSIGSMNIKSFVGKVYPEIDPISESIGFDFDDGMDFLRNDTNNISWSDPQINLNLTSTFSVPVRMDLNLSSKKKDGSYIGRDIKPDLGYITLPACPRDLLSKTTTIVIYKNERIIPQSDDTIFVRMSSLSDLMTTVPDSLYFNMTAEADTSMIDEANFHYVDITRELSVEGGYDVTIPLSFDSLYIEYNDTIDSLSADLKDIADKLKSASIKITAQVESSIPLSVDISAIPLDLAGNVITSGIEVTASGIAAGTESSPVTTNLELTVTVNDGRLSILDAFIIKATCVATQTEGGSDLKGSGYLHIKNMVMSVLGGIDVDLTDLD